jgi:hypothetical protein
MKLLWFVGLGIPVQELESLQGIDHIYGLDIATAQGETFGSFKLVLSRIDSKLNVFKKIGFFNLKEMEVLNLKELRKGVKSVTTSWWSLPTISLRCFAKKCRSEARNHLKPNAQRH